MRLYVKLISNEKVVFDISFGFGRFGVLADKAGYGTSEL